MIDKQGSPLWLVILSLKNFSVSAREFYEHHGVGRFQLSSLGLHAVCLSLASIMQLVPHSSALLIRSRAHS